MELIKAKFAYNYMKGVVNRGLGQMPAGEECDLLEKILLAALEDFRSQAKAQIKAEENQ